MEIEKVLIPQIDEKNEIITSNHEHLDFFAFLRNCTETRISDLVLLDHWDKKMKTINTVYPGERLKLEIKTKLDGTVGLKRLHFKIFSTNLSQILTEFKIEFEVFPANEHSSKHDDSIDGKKKKQ